MLKKYKKNVRLTKKFPFIRVTRKGRASLVVVEDLWTKCNTEAEKLLYHQLRANMYYPTPHYWIEHIRANLALVPYKLALIEFKPGMDEKRIIKQLKKRQWRVIFYDTDQLLKDERRYFDLILKQAPTKNVSSSS
ncbi:hypothetical protein [Halalkalibacter akibai]|uniref:Uncharacterized protein n=1 Tax=Halalkalibacter akibai (strain ATCC 43226 / DSM 21942 / CIP 109018 / JCM 9157 / 1139) TaxID=1236973 RepID=W4QS53_HALA3|nr:hypothetical protein [Halalkalibacter akibai]GAE34906.1 hypothetical protein JCM9157_1989 [Halalkalibacter akibai JCM 9157]